MITIVDYGMGNLGSLENMFRYIGLPAQTSSKREVIEQATKLVLPGVGAFDRAMNKIREGGLRDILAQKALKEKIPVLGVCLGMQLLTEYSEEGNVEGLGWIPAQTCKIPVLEKLKVPHMGWNSVYFDKKDPLIKGMDADSRFYFVHSYYVKVKNEENSLLKAKHGVTFDAAIKLDNIYGAQFHPEKSHKHGMQLLKNFGEL